MFADIIVDISHEDLDKIFQYIIPDSLINEISIGMLVEIPFGKGNRLIKGYIVNITDEPNFDIKRMKEIVSISEGSIVIESQLIKLAWWIKESYGSTMINALKTVIPVKQSIKTKDKKYIKLNIETKEAKEHLENFIKKNNTAKVRLLTELLNDQILEYNIVTNKLAISPNTIKSLSAQNIIKIIIEEEYRNPIKESDKINSDIALTKPQKEIILDQTNEYNSGIRKTYLLRGITGSGKTEVYMELIDNVIKQNKQAIVLIPEIALTYQTVMRFYQKFGDRVSILNSRLSQGERYDQYLRAKRGEIDIMIGPRSALFTPFNNLGLIIIDEEHESTYKSDTSPKYHAREVAIYRATMAGASVVLGSATPSIETYTKALNGEYKLYELLTRAKSNSKLSSVHIVDLRKELSEGNKSILSNKLKELITNRLDKKEQTMIFINRRGYAGFVSCRSCGFVIKCSHCDVSLTAHKGMRSKEGVNTYNKLVCHYCGHEERMPDNCPECNSKYIAAFGVGTQKVEELIQKEFPMAKLLRMDMDTTKKKDSHEKILSSFSNNEADILIGTQMIVKGHDFPNVTLVGIIAADLSLFSNDYRASERTFQLLTQACGRAGRGGKLGEVVIQTYNPDHYSIVSSGNQDYEEFYRQEIQFRSILKYPPISEILAILVISNEEKIADDNINYLSEVIKRKTRNIDIELIGPASTTISKINDTYRRIIYIKHNNLENLKIIRKYLEKLIDNSQAFNKCMVQFDFNPMNTY